MAIDDPTILIITEFSIAVASFLLLVLVIAVVGRRLVVEAVDVVLVFWTDQVVGDCGSVENTFPWSWWMVVGNGNDWSNTLTAIFYYLPVCTQQGNMLN